MRGFTAVSINGISLSNTFQQDSEKYTGGIERLQEPEVWEDGSKTLSLGHAETNAFLNSEQLWLPTQDQASQYSSMDREKTGNLSPLTTELLRADGCQGKKSHF